jgi:regulator of nucleoside diphosphate kinase
MKRASIMAKKEKNTESSVVITVTQLDFLRLTRLIQTLRGNKSVDLEYLKFLGIELQKALKIDSKLITPDFVTMNSVMNVVFLDSGKTMELRLVYPQNADFSKGLISVLSPLGCALLGYKAGDIVTFKAPKGELKVRIENVIYQPEANGEDLL